jgi:hypothetical protein
MRRLWLLPALSLSLVPHLASTAAEPARPVFKVCVLHAGETHRASSSTGPSTVSCWHDAECVEHPGQPRAGDGFGDIACDGGDCTCSLRPVFAERPVTWRVSLDHPCDHIAQALVEVCLAGIPVSGHGDGGVR